MLSLALGQTPPRSNSGVRREETTATHHFTSQVVSVSPTAPSMILTSPGPVAMREVRAPLLGLLSNHD